MAHGAKNHLELANKAESSSLFPEVICFYHLDNLEF